MKSSHTAACDAAHFSTAQLPPCSETDPSIQCLIDEDPLALGAELFAGLVAATRDENEQFYLDVAGDDECEENELNEDAPEEAWPNLAGGGERNEAFGGPHASAEAEGSASETGQTTAQVSRAFAEGGERRDEAHGLCAPSLRRLHGIDSHSTGPSLSRSSKPGRSTADRPHKQYRSKYFKALAQLNNPVNPKHIIMAPGLSAPRLDAPHAATPLYAQQPVRGAAELKLQPAMQPIRP
jgi:hypothetical protein